MINNKRKSLRLISRLEIKSTNVVKGINMEGLRVVGNPEIIAKQYFLDGIDETNLFGRLDHMLRQSDTSIEDMKTRPHQTAVLDRNMPGNFFNQWIFITYKTMIY